MSSENFFYVYVAAVTLQELFEKINTMVDDGYEPFESIFTDNDNNFCQMMRKKLGRNETALEMYGDFFEKNPGALPEPLEDDIEPDEDQYPPGEEEILEADLVRGAMSTSTLQVVGGEEPEKSPGEKEEEYVFNIFRSKPLPATVEELKNYIAEGEHLLVRLKHRSSMTRTISLKLEEAKEKIKGLD